MSYRIIHDDPRKQDGVVSRSFWTIWPFGREYKCGHREGATFMVRVRGAIVAPTPGNDMRCAPCTIDWLRDRILSCSLCGGAMYPGESVWMLARQPHRPIPFEASRALEIGCLRFGCAVAPDPLHLWHWDGELLLPPEAAHP